MKISTFYGFKIGQTQAFDKAGKRLAVTRLRTPDLKVIRIKTEAKNGYSAAVVQFPRGLRRVKTKALAREIKLTRKVDLKKGQIIKIAEVFSAGDKIQVRAKSKGRGFAGVMKRWGFAGGPRTHGQSDRQRAPGSIGQRTDPGRVWKGKKMPGRMGGAKKFIKGLQVFKVDGEKRELLITGLVPGGRGNLVQISKQSK